MSEPQRRSNLHLLDGMDLKDLDVKTEYRTPMDIVRDTLIALGKTYTAAFNRVLVCTDPPVRVTPGGIILTNTESGFWAGQGHKKIIKATVIAVDPSATEADPDMKPGARICFQRLHFSWLEKLKDGNYFGAIEQPKIVGYIEQE